LTTNAQRYGAVIVALLATVAAAKVIDTRPAEALDRPLDAINTTLDGWKSEMDPPLSPDILKELDPTSYISRTYSRAGEKMSLFVAYYANQHAGESMHSPKHCLPGSGWEFLTYGKTDLRIDGQDVRVNHDVIQKDGSRMSVIYWYQSRRRVVADEYMAKFFLIRDAVVERRTGGSIVRIICNDDAAGVASGLAFAETVLPEVQRCMTSGLTLRTESK